MITIAHPEQSSGELKTPLPEPAATVAGDLSNMINLPNNTFTVQA